MTTEDDFQKQLDAHPDDHHTRLVFADWLEERGDERAEGYRALGLRRRIPGKVAGTWYFNWVKNRHWTASLQATKSIRLRGNPAFTYEPSSRTLPEFWMERAGKGHRGTWTLKLPSRREVEDAAALAFAKLPAARRAALLAVAPVG